MKIKSSQLPLHQ